MQRPKFSHEFKLQAVKPVPERGVSVSQAACDLDLNEDVLRQWVREPGVHRTAGRSGARHAREDIASAER